MMELLDFAADESWEGIEDALENWTEQGKMTKEMAACIRPEEILKFLESSCGRRMKQAAGSRRLYREQPFVLGIEAGEVYPQSRRENFCWCRESLTSGLRKKTDWWSWITRRIRLILQRN